MVRKRSSAWSNVVVESCVFARPVGDLVSAKESLLKQNRALRSELADLHAFFNISARGPSTAELVKHFSPLSFISSLSFSLSLLSSLFSLLSTLSSLSSLLSLSLFLCSFVCQWRGWLTESDPVFPRSTRQKVLTRLCLCRMLTEGWCLARSLSKNTC